MSIFRPTMDQRNTFVRKSIALDLPAGNLAVGTEDARIVMPEAGEIVEVSVSCKTAPTGAAAVFDVNLDGTTIYTTQGNRPTVAISAKDSTQAGGPEAGVFERGDVLTVDTDVIGSTVTGADATVLVTYIARAAHVA